MKRYVDDSFWIVLPADALKSFYLCTSRIAPDSSLTSNAWTMVNLWLFISLPLTKYPVFKALKDPSIQYPFCPNETPVPARLRVIASAYQTCTKILFNDILLRSILDQIYLLERQLFPVRVPVSS
jgi:hypothetical protein